MGYEIKRLVDFGRSEFERRRSLDVILQDIAEMVMPMRAIYLSDSCDVYSRDYTRRVDTGLPAQACLEYSNFLGTLLNNPNLDWGRISVYDSSDISLDAKLYLEDVSRRQRSVYYAPETNATASMQQFRRDYAHAGMACNRIDWDIENSRAYFNNIHISRVCWLTNGYGQIDRIFVKYDYSLEQLVDLFGTESLSDNLRSAWLSGKGSLRVKCYHIVCRRELYDGDKYDGDKLPWVSIFVGRDDYSIYEVKGSINEKYHIALHELYGDSHYAYSPPTMSILPEGRALHAMQATIMATSEFNTNPALLVRGDVLRSNLNFYPGGIINVDSEYDERQGRIIEPFSGGGDIGGALNVYQDIRQQLYSGYQLDKMNLPVMTGMTAYEVNKRIEEYIRNIQPLLDPTLQEINGKMYRMLFEVLNYYGVFGSPYDIPEDLVGRQPEFIFTTGITNALDEGNAQKFMEGMRMIGEVINVYPEARYMVDIDKALRDSLHGIGFKSKWLRDGEQVQELMQQDVMSQQMRDEIEQVNLAADAASKVVPLMKQGGV